MLIHGYKTLLLLFQLTSVFLYSLRCGAFRESKLSCEIDTDVIIYSVSRSRLFIIAPRRRISGDFDVVIVFCCFMNKRVMRIHTS